MSNPNHAAEMGEFMNTRMQIVIKIHGNDLERSYQLDDGKIPENMENNLQEMVDTLLDTSEL